MNLLSNFQTERSSTYLSLNWLNHQVSFFLESNILYFSLRSGDREISLQKATGAVFLQNQKNQLITLIPEPINQSLETAEISEYENEVGRGLQIQFHCVFKPKIDISSQDIELPCRWRFQIITERKNGIKFVSEPLLVTSQIFIDLIPPELKSYGLYAFAPLYMKGTGILHLAADFKENQKNPRQYPENITFYSNGWQSWSNNYLLEYSDKWPSSPVKLGRINMENQEKRLLGRYQSEYHTVISDKKSRCGLILGFLTLKDQFSRVVMDRIQPKGRVDWLCAYSQTDGISLSGVNEGLRKSELLAISIMPTPESFEMLTEICRIGGVYAKIPSKSPVMTGWCSWYYYYTQVKETDVLSNLDFFSEHDDYPIDLIQLDDGYQTAIGDWGTETGKFNEKFPHGLKWLADKIHHKSFKAGLWIAPFFITKKSEFYRLHSDWMLRNKVNRPISTAYNWGANQYAIDLSRPEVCDYITKEAKVISQDWGFDFLKIDFLYAPEAIDLKYQQPGFSRAQILRRGLESVRKGFGESKIILGCGCPLGPAVGTVDVMRIGPDTAASWFKNEFLFYKIGKISPDSLKPALKSTIQRSYQHKTWWINDPDCVVVREDRSDLTLDEIYLQLTVFGLSGGQILISDDEKKVSQERMDLLNRILPVYSISERNGVSPEVVPLDLFLRSEPTLYAKTVELNIASASHNLESNVRHLVCCINWNKRSKTLTYKIRDILIYKDQIDYSNRQEFWIFDYWEEKLIAKKKIEDKLVLSDVPAHGCKYLAIVPIVASLEDDNAEQTLPFRFISSTIHISQGALEINNYQINSKEQEMIVDVDIPGKHAGHLYFLGKSENSEDLKVECNQTMSSKATSFGILYKIHVFADPKCKVLVKWSKRKAKKES